MRVIKAEAMGTCFGVDRAINIFFDRVKNKGDVPLYTYGQLVHNKQILEKIKNYGVEELFEPGDAAPGEIVIRAHGISCPKYLEFERAGFRIFDATCPIVKRNISSIVMERNPVIYIGERTHCETVSYKNSSLAPFYIVEKKEDLLPLDRSKFYSVYVQTTYSTEGYDLICGSLDAMGFEYEHKAFICKASILRRKAVDELVKKVRVVVVIGDRLSSNSMNLVRKVEKNGCIPFLVESLSDLDSFPYKEEEVVGLTAAASIMRTNIDKVYHKLITM